MAMESITDLLAAVATEVFEAASAFGGAMVATSTGQPFDGTVAASSRVIAAFRAIETQEGEAALLHDPLAQYLAGTEALTQVQATLQPCSSAPGSTSQRKYAANRLSFRARWFDDQVCDAIRKSGAALQQVVLLGAGMDSRAWRLDALHGLSWYELDRPGVLRAKLQMLAPAGAQMPQHPVLTCTPGAAVTANPAPTAPTDKGQALRFPFKCATWRGVEHDLTDPAWIKTLQQAGWNANAPTLWIAEGLILYLEQDKADAVLQIISDHSAPGSSFVVGLVTRESIAAFQQNQYKDNALVKEFRSGVPSDAVPFFSKLGWMVAKELGYVGISLPYRADGMECNLASAHQLDVNESDLERYFRFFVLTKYRA